VFYYGDHDGTRTHTDETWARQDRTELEATGPDNGQNRTWLDRTVSVWSITAAQFVASVVRDLEQYRKEYKAVQYKLEWA